MHHKAVVEEEGEEEIGTRSAGLVITTITTHRALGLAVLLTALIATRWKARPAFSSMIDHITIIVRSTGHAGGVVLARSDMRLPNGIPLVPQIDEASRMKARNFEHNTN